MPTELAAMPEELAAMPTELAAMSDDIAAMPTELAAMPTELGAMPEELAAMPTDEQGVGEHEATGAAAGIRAEVNDSGLAMPTAPEAVGSRQAFDCFEADSTRAVCSR